MPNRSAFHALLHSPAAILMRPINYSKYFTGHKTEVPGVYLVCSPG